MNLYVEEAPEAMKPLIFRLFGLRAEFVFPSHCIVAVVQSHSRLHDTQSQEGGYRSKITMPVVLIASRGVV